MNEALSALGAGFYCAVLVDRAAAGDAVAGVLFDPLGTAFD